MATFIKLTNGDIVNRQHIKSIKRHEYMGAGALARAFNESRQEKGSQESNRMKTVPSIELQLSSDPNSLLLKYESEQERNTEFERLEAILLQARTIVAFGSLMFDTRLIQSLSTEWEEFDTVLRLWVKMPGTRRFIVEVDQVNQAEWELCMSLLAQFNMQLPPAVRKYDF